MGGKNGLAVGFGLLRAGEELCTWKAKFKSFLIHASLRKVSLPVLLRGAGITLHVAPVSAARDGGERTQASRSRPVAPQPGLPGFSSGHASLITLLLSGNEAGSTLKSLTQRQALPGL